MSDVQPAAGVPPLQLTPKPPLSFWQIFNMSFGFFGIQFGWDLQRANMGPIYEFLHASPDQIPLLFLAAPLTGLIVQPIIGYMSDRTWHPWWGRRRPYFFVGAFLSTICLFFMPNIFGVSRSSTTGQIPDSVKYAFYTGGTIFLVSVLYTVFTSKEYPPADLAFREKVKESNKGFGGGIREINHAIFNMPTRMRQLALVQFFTCPGLSLVWFYYSTAVARNVFRATSEHDPVYTRGVEFAGLTLSFYNIIAFLFALLIPVIAAQLGRKLTHSICLLCGALVLLAVGMVSDKYYLYVCMVGVGIAWSSILSMPYAMLAGSLPEDKIGVYMGIFNFFIVLPEIIASLFFGWIMQHWLNNDRMLAVQIGGVLMILAAVICYSLIREDKSELSDDAAIYETADDRPV